MQKINLKDSHNGSYGTMYYVNDMVKSVSYYKEMLDWKPLFESPQWTEFQMADGHRLCLHSLGEGQKVDGKGILITSVKNIEAVVAEMKSRGVEFTQDISEVCENGYSANYRDPSGNLLSLFEFKS